MELKRIEDIEKPEKSTVITVGVFDGVHVGHKFIFKELLEIGKKKKLLPLVITFYPHPDTVLGKGKTLLIQTLSQKIEKIREEGIENVVAIRFDEDFSKISAGDFIDILIKDFKMKGILVGENFRFGKGMEGNIDFLREIAKKKGFEVFTVKIFEIDGKKISSSLIRNLLLEGRVEEVIPFLGRPYSIKGRVVRGFGIGKRLGIPTANIQSDNEILPMGVFVTKFHLKGKALPSVTNIGHAPTLKETEKSVESHIINFQGEILGEEVEISLLTKIRDEMKFKDEKELRDRIIKDIEIAKDYFEKIKI
jgi:riboflavin kinase/FMN adenylyltransferase